MILLQHNPSVLLTSAPHMRRSRLHRALPKPKYALCCSESKPLCQQDIKGDHIREARHGSIVLPAEVCKHGGSTTCTLSALKEQVAAILSLSRVDDMSSGTLVVHCLIRSHWQFQRELCRGFSRCGWFPGAG